MPTDYRTAHLAITERDNAREDAQELADYWDRTDEDEEEDDPPASYRDGVDGHWYVCRYDRTLPQIHALDCDTCAAELASRGVQS